MIGEDISYIFFKRAKKKKAPLYLDPVNTAHARLRNNCILSSSRTSSSLRKLTGPHPCVLEIYEVILYLVGLLLA